MSVPKLLVMLVSAGMMLSGYAGKACAEDGGVIKGKAIFKGDPEKFKRTGLDTTKDANCNKKIGSEDVVVDAGTPPTLRNVLVSIKEGLGDKKFPVPATPAVLNQEGCQYTPHVLGVVEGQQVEIKNSDPTAHNIHFLPKINEELNRSQPKQGAVDKTTLKTEAAFKVKCDVHPWMGMWIAVFPHPFFAVTDKTGAYEIKGLPPGKYTVEAWHEKFGTMTQPIEVDPSKAPAALDFTFEPK